MATGIGEPPRVKRRRRGFLAMWDLHPGVPSGDELTFSERAADKLRNSMGSWVFVFTFIGVMAAWAIANSVFYLAGTNGKHGFDPYPYILLNLFLSMVAGLQGLGVCACLALWQRRGKDPRADRALRWSPARVLSTVATQAFSAWAHILILAPSVPLCGRLRLMARCLGF